MNRRRRSESLKPIRACQSAARRALAALCVVAALGSASAPALADEVQSVICIYETAANAQGFHDWEDSDAGSLTEKLAERHWLEAFDSLVACVAQKEGICGHVGRMYHDEIALPDLSMSERSALVNMVWNCVYLDNPDG